MNPPSPLKAKFRFLAAAVLTAAFLLIPVARAADPEMPAPFDSNGSKTRQFMTYGEDRDHNRVPTKTLRITNNSGQTVYPIMRDPNPGPTPQLPPGVFAGNKYDPYDDANREYRGYIGYCIGNPQDCAEGRGSYHFGLKDGKSILVSVPLVFWNAARIGIGTDSKYLRWTGQTRDPNPLRYRPNSQRSITETPKSGDTIGNGVVMWYRADTAEAFGDDAEDQLAEWTIRDHGYLNSDDIKRESHNEIPPNQKLTLINYDVSNVDNLYLPVAMAANDVWVLPQIGFADHWQKGDKPDDYGWTGAINTIDFLQTKIRKFTANNNALLGEYFGDKKHGWPFYNIPNPTNDPEAPIKISSGANIFAQSPLKDVPSSYGNGQWQNDKYMLSSGGTEPKKVGIGHSGAKVNAAGSRTLNLNEADPEITQKFAAIKVGDKVTGRPAT